MGSSKRGRQREATEISQLDSEEVELESAASSLIEVDFGVLSHAGDVSSSDEACYLVVRAERSLQTIVSNLPGDLLSPRAAETAYGMVLADGISGMPAGALASRIALQKLIELVVKTPDWIMRMNRRKAAVVKRRMTERFHEIDLTLREHGKRDPKLAGMGATMTVACSLGSDLFLGHIGDSRAYLLRSDQFYQLTRDHTLARAMVEAGIAEDETVRGMRRVLTAALGSTPLSSVPDVQRFHLHEGDKVLLCTNGLTESVDSQTIVSLLQNAGSSQEACRTLVGTALQAGGNDNIAVILARYRLVKPAPSTTQPITC